MAEALQHGQTAFIARISATGATDDEPVPDATRSDHADAIISLSRWYKKSVRPPKESPNSQTNVSARDDRFPVVRIVQKAAVKNAPPLPKSGQY